MRKMSHRGIAFPVLLGKILFLALLLTTLCGLTACGPSSPAEKVAKTRRQYTVKFNAWRVQTKEAAAEEVSEPADPAVAGEAPEAGEDAPAGEGDAGGEDLSEELAEVDLGPQPSSVLFDLLVRFDGREPLAGITVEVTHADPFEKEKELRLHYIDLSVHAGAEKTKQISFVLDDFAYEDGDVFSVDYQLGVPEAERGGYREFADSAP